MIIPRKMGRKMLDSVPKNAHTAFRWYMRKNRRIAAAMTQNAVTPAAR
jgi:hypothetical protein